VLKQNQHIVHQSRHRTRLNITVVKTAVSRSYDSHLHYSSDYSFILIFQTIIRSKTYYLVIISSLILYQRSSAAVCKLCRRSFSAKGFYPWMCNTL